VSAFNPGWVVAPGETLREWRLWNHLSVSAAATACGRMPIDFYEGIEAGTQPIDERVADALAHGTQIPTFLWQNLERAFRAGLASGKHWDGVPVSVPVLEVDSPDSERENGS
jgi:hypothetical protein